MHIEDFGRRGSFGRHPAFIITGATISGCVRATAVDALQYGFRLVVPGEAIGERNPDAHEAKLYDLDAKYGDVVPLEETLEYLEEVNAIRIQ
jgi:maleamate amidohydrolase